MMGLIGLFIGLVLMALGLAMLVGLVRLLCDGKAAAAVLLGLTLFGGLGMALVALVLFANATTPHKVVTEGWVDAPSEGRPLLQRSISQGPSGQTITETYLLPPSSEPTRAVPVVAEVTEIEDEAPATIIASQSKPAEPAVTQPTPAATTSEEVVAAPRPDWLNRSPEWIEGDYRLVVASGLFPTVADAESDLLAKARKQLADYYVKEHSLEEEHLPIPEAELDRLVSSQVIRERYNEPVKSDVLETTMYRTHGLLVISPELRSKLDAIWSAQIVDRRLVHTGQGAGGLLALLLVAWGTLKMRGRKAGVGVQGSGSSPQQKRC